MIHIDYIKKYKNSYSPEVVHLNLQDRHKHKDIQSHFIVSKAQLKTSTFKITHTCFHHRTTCSTGSPGSRADT